MADDAAGGAEIAVTDEMLTAGAMALSEALAAGAGSPGAVTLALLAAYRTMRALESEKPSGVTVYDVYQDKLRPVTRADVQSWEAISRAYAALRKHVDETHAKLQAEVMQIRSAAGLPHV